ncbi:hypothetical protein KLP28_06440 [Nocardioidaceae bacterium]|nr:hypothetical protein KLP28_06440 [Nocardioidaceae bacterium]
MLTVTPAAASQAGTQESRCAPDVLRDAGRQSPAVDPGILYDGILDYAPFASLPDMVDAFDLAVLDEVTGWRTAVRGRDDAAAVMQVAVIESYASTPAGIDDMAIRFGPSHRFFSGDRVQLTLEEKSSAIPIGACVIVVGERGGNVSLPPQGLMVERADGSFTGARVPRRDFSRWLPPDTPPRDEFAVLVAQLQRMD